MEEWKLPDEAHAKDTLEKLKENSATGPDLIPTRVLKRFAAALSKPLYKLAKRLLETGRWPEVWLEHWVIPLYKKKSVWDPANYSLQGCPPDGPTFQGSRKDTWKLFLTFLAKHWSVWAKPVCLLQETGMQRPPCAQCSGMGLAIAPRKKSWILLF